MLLSIYRISSKSSSDMEPASRPQCFPQFFKASVDAVLTPNVGKV